MINIQWIDIPILSTQRPSDTKVCHTCTNSYCIMLTNVMIIYFWDVKKIVKRLRNISKSRYLFYHKIIFVLKTLLVGETHFFFLSIWSIKLIYIWSTQNIFWELHVASIVDYYAIIENKVNHYWKLLLSQLLPNLCQFSGSAIVSENSEDTVSWLFY